MSIFQDVKRRANLEKARAKLDQPMRVFSRRRDEPCGPFVETVDLGVMPYRKYRQLREGTLMCYVAQVVQDNDCYRQFVEFYQKEMAGQA
jgi:hypothetical protein